MADYKTQTAWDAENTKKYGIKLNCRTDADIIERLETLTESRMGYLKRLIREDIRKNKPEE